MKDNYTPVPGRTPNALFNKAESITDITDACDYLSTLFPVYTWQNADRDFMKAILCYVYETHAPEDRNMDVVKELIEMELMETENVKSGLYELMKRRKQFAKEHGIEEELCTYYYSHFRSYPLEMRLAIARQNFYRFGFTEDDGRTVTFI